MNQEIPQDIYRNAYNEAALELQKIHSEFERLSMRRDKIAKVVEVLKPKVSFDNHVPADNMSLTTKLAGLTVVTRLSILRKVSHP